MHACIQIALYRYRYCYMSCPRTAARRSAPPYPVGTGPRPRARRCGSCRIGGRAEAAAGGYSQYLARPGGSCRGRSPFRVVYVAMLRRRSVACVDTRSGSVHRRRRRRLVCACVRVRLHVYVRACALAAQGRRRRSTWTSTGVSGSRRRGGAPSIHHQRCC